MTKIKTTDSEEVAARKEAVRIKVALRRYNKECYKCGSDSLYEDKFLCLLCYNKMKDGQKLPSQLAINSRKRRTDSTRTLSQFRRDNGLCVRCGTTQLVATSLCLPCFNKKSEQDNICALNRKQFRADNNLCYKCAVPLSGNRLALGSAKCDDCCATEAKKAKDKLPKLFKPVWAELFKAYGKVCSCCGESNVGLLTLDHINNDGNFDRKLNSAGGFAFYRRVISLGCPDTLRFLCYNCNCGRQRLGGVCPHTLEGKNILIDRFGFDYEKASI